VAKALLKTAMKASEEKTISAGEMTANGRDGLEAGEEMKKKENEEIMAEKLKLKMKGLYRRKYSGMKTAAAGSQRKSKRNGEMKGVKIVIHRERKTRKEHHQRKPVSAILDFSVKTKAISGKYSLRQRHI
jgi:hypothetical protein